VKAKQNYELAWKEWAELYRDYPKLVDDVTLDESVGLLKPYRDLLAQLGEPFPKDFPLNWLVDAQKALLSQYQRTGPSQESESAQGETSGKAGKK
jgi:hypothetical protein